MAAEILYEETMVKGLRSIDSRVQQLTNIHHQLQKSVEAMNNKLGHLQSSMERLITEFWRTSNDKGIASEYGKVKNSQQQNAKNKLEFLEHLQNHEQENQQELSTLEMQELCIEDQLFDKMSEPEILVINQRSSMVFRRWRKSYSYDSSEDEHICVNVIELDPSSVASEVWYGKESGKHLMKRIGVSTIYSQFYPFEGMLNYTYRIIHHVKIHSLEHVTKYYHKCGDKEWRYNFSKREACTIKKSKTERSSKNFDRLQKSKIDLDAAQVTDVNNYRIFVATWNVVGKFSPSNLNLEDGLHTSPSTDNYVIGFQEIVPLNAGNVLGTKDNGPAKNWLSLIQRTLNSLSSTNGGGYYTPSPVHDPIMELDADFEGSTRQKASSFIHRYSFQSLNHSMRMIDDMSIPQPRLDRRFSVCDRVMFGQKPSYYDPNVRWGGSSDEKSGDFPALVTTLHCYTVGLYLWMMEIYNQGTRGTASFSVNRWLGFSSGAKNDRNMMKVSCVGKGLMGYLGNKGSISISMSLHQTSFCFICNHLTSRQKEGNELRRNSDVLEIIRKIRFPRVHGMGNEKSPKTILEHDQIIWLGDLNYRTPRAALLLFCKDSCCNAQ